MSVYDRLNEIDARVSAATDGPWEVGNWDSVAGVNGMYGAGNCCYCRDDSRPTWVGQRDINGKRMLAHVHRSIPYDGDTSIYAARKDGSVVVALSTEEYVSIDPNDATFIAAAPRDVLALLAALRAVLNLVSDVGNEHTGPEYVACYEVHDAIAHALEVE